MLVRNVKSGKYASTRAEKISGVEGLKVSARMSKTIASARLAGKSSAEIIADIKRTSQSKY